jgi:protein ImuB
VFLPLLSSERITQGRRNAHLDTRPDTHGDIPFVLTEKKRGAVHVVAADARAQTLGIGNDMTLADARARVPELIALPHDPIADGLLLDWLAEECDRYTPMVALAPPYGLILDITGCTHSFTQGEATLRHDLMIRLTRHGLSARSSLASTPDMAFALARYGAEDVRDLPVTALYLSDDAHSAMRRAGLYSLGHLADRPRAPLAARFGTKASGLLARVLGEVDVRITPRRMPPALSIDQRFAEPIAREEDALSTLDALCADMAVHLSERGTGGRRFDASLFRSDGHVARLSIETSSPTRDAALLNRLFRERIGGLSDPLDPGFGYDLIRLDVPVTDSLTPEQFCLEGGSVAEAEIVALVDRLAVRLGRHRLRRLSAGNSHIPEQASLSLPIINAPPSGSWPQPESGEPPLRPLYLFDPPQRIIVIAEVPDGPPHRFRWRRGMHDVTRFEGPERIAAEWWKRPSMTGLTRDYYRVEDQRGRRFWLFRHGLYGSERTDPDWYLHGLFA